MLEELRTLDLDGEGRIGLDLTDPAAMTRSRVLHRLRVLKVPGFQRKTGPLTGADPVLEERWRLTPCDERVAALIEAAAFGGTLAEAASGALQRRIPDASIDDLTGVLFDAALCGITTLSDDVIKTLAERVRSASDVAALGVVLAGVLGLWRHDRLFGTARDPVLGAVIDVSATRILWLVEGLHSGPAPVDTERLRAMVATRDAVVHAESVLTMRRDDVQGVARRIASDAKAPPDLRGAALGLGWALGELPDVERALRGMAAPDMLGDWLAGLFALAREDVLTSEHVVGVLDELVHAMTEAEFLIALPALRLAFAYFPPLERETIAERVLAHRGAPGSGRSLTRVTVDPLVVAEGMALDRRVDDLLVREGLA